MMPFQRVAVKRLLICMGVDQKNQVISQTLMPNATTKIFVVPGSMAIIEVQTPNGLVIRETPIGSFGWEYTGDEDQQSMLGKSN